MRRLFFALTAFAMLVTSCAKDATTTPAVVEGESVVSFKISTPDINTRYGEGTTANKLFYAVYQNNELKEDVSALTEDKAVDINITANVEIQLVSGLTYQILFWAQNEDAPYAFDGAKVTIDHTALKANEEAYDAFFCNYKAVINGTTPHFVELYRPFAQLNIGTNDVEEAKKAAFDLKNTSVKVKTNTVLDLATGAASEPVELTYALNTKAEGKYEDYDIISVNYLLVGGKELASNDGKELVDITFEAEDTAGKKISRSYTSVPLERNHRTYMLGEILTTTSLFNVVIMPGFDGTLPETPEEKLALAAQLGGKYTLTEDVVLEETLAVTSDFTINLNGKTLKYTEDNRMARVYEGATLTINGEGTVEVDSDNLDASTTAAYIATVYEGGTIVINGGKHVTNGCTLYHANGGKVIINGGEFDANETGYSQQGKYGHKYTLNIQGANGEIVVYGGTFHNYNPAQSEGENPVANFVAEGYSAKSADNKVWTVSEMTEAEKLADAATKGGEFTLTEDVVLETPINVTSNFVLNLNGKTIEAKGDEVDAILVTGTGSLTVNGEGKVIGTMDAIWAMDDATVTINGGTFEGVSEAVYVRDNAKAVIYNGNFKVEGEWGTTYTLNLKDEHRTTSSITVYGGTFYNFNPANNTAENEGTNFVAEGYKSIQNGEYWVVVANEVDAVASSAGEMNDALANGSSVTMVTDIVTDKSIQMTNGGVIDGNNNAISGDLTGYYNSAINTNGGVIKNLSIITGCERSITSNGLTEDLYLENITTDKTGYGMNIRNENSNPTELFAIHATKCAFKGWSSFAGISSADFTECDFAQGEYWVHIGYADVFDRLLKPYVNTTFTNCNFEKGFYLDLSAYNGTSVKFVNCTVDGVKLTKEMFKNSTDSPSNNQLVSELDGDYKLWYEATDDKWATVSVE